MDAFVVFLVILVIVIVVLTSCIKIVPQAQAVVLERLGAYQSTWNVGLHFKLPFVDRIAKRVSLKEQVADFPPQPVITKDNVTMRIDTVVYYQITDPRLFVYGVERPMMAIENLTATTLRNIIGDLDLDGTLTNPERGLIASFVYAFKKMGIEYGEKSELKRFIGPPIYEAWQKEFGLTPEESAKVVTIMRAQEKSADNMGAPVIL